MLRPCPERPLAVHRHPKAPCRPIPAAELDGCGLQKARTTSRPRRHRRHHCKVPSTLEAASPFPAAEVAATRFRLRDGVHR